MFLEFLRNPEKLLKMRLDRNCYYPFCIVTTNVYMLTFATHDHVIGWIGCLTTVLVTVVVCVCIKRVTEFVVVSILLFLYFLPRSLKPRGKRILVLDMNDDKHFYEYYINDKLLYHGHVHNVYIRLRSISSSGKTFYWLTVDGYGFDSRYDITAMPSSRPERLDRLGRRIAASVGINYFDSVNVSTRHVIRHRCPYVDNTKCPQDVNNCEQSSSAVS